MSLKLFQQMYVIFSLKKYLYVALHLSPQGIKTPALKKLKLHCGSRVKARYG